MTSDAARDPLDALRFLILEVEATLTPRAELPRLLRAELAIRDALSAVGYACWVVGLEIELFVTRRVLRPATGRIRSKR